jgi:hypothetical protein
VTNDEQRVRTPRNHRHGVTALWLLGLRVSPAKSEPAFSDISEAMNESSAVSPAISEPPPITTVTLRPLPVVQRPPSARPKSACGGPNPLSSPRRGVRNDLNPTKIISFEDDRRQAKLGSVVQFHVFQVRRHRRGVLAEGPRNPALPESNIQNRLTFAVSATVGLRLPLGAVRAISVIRQSCRHRKCPPAVSPILRADPSHKPPRRRPAKPDAQIRLRRTPPAADCQVPGKPSKAT